MVVILEEPSDLPCTAPGLPPNYNFEIKKTLKTLHKMGAKKVALQFPDGLLCYAPIIIDCIQTHTNADCVILNDVVYGACCVDDQSVPADILIHYGHSCLIPVTEMTTRVLYVFVDIKIDLDHLKTIILKTFTGTVALIGTIQFNSSVNRLKHLINNSGQEGISAYTPQAKPLSPGEVLGCTSPVISNAENVVYVGDGRFHLESAMIRNPQLNFYKYCPFRRQMTREFYAYDKMVALRKGEIARAFGGRTFGVVLGSLGRQGNRIIMENLVKALEQKYTVYRIVVDELNQKILDTFPFVDAFVQVSCPRLSIDWGASYHKPLLSPYEVLSQWGSSLNEEYQMDYYSNEGSAPWKNYNNQLS